MSDEKNNSLRSGWRRVRLGDVVENIDDFFDRDSQQSVRYVAGEHIDEGDLIVRRHGSTSDELVPPTFKRLFKAGDVLFHSRNLRKLARPSFDGLTGEKIFVLRAKTNSELLQDFLPWLLQSEDFKNYVNDHWAGSTNKFLNKTPLMSYEFMLPPVVEQIRFVTMIGHIVDLEEQLRIAEVESDKLQKAAVQELLDANLNGWPTRPIGDVFKVTTGGTPSRNEASFWNGDVPWVKTGEVNYTVIESTEESITSHALKGSAAKLCPKGSVLVALYGQGPTRGRVGMLGIEAAVNQACAAIYPCQGFDPWFLYYYLTGQYLSLRAMAQGAAQPNLNLSMIKGFHVPIPAIEEQAIAVAKIEALAKARAEIRQRRRKTAELKQKLREEAIDNVVH